MMMKLINIHGEEAIYQNGKETLYILKNKKELQKLQKQLKPTRHTPIQPETTPKKYFIRYNTNTPGYTDKKTRIRWRKRRK